MKNKSTKSLKRKLNWFYEIILYLVIKIIEIETTTSNIDIAEDISDISLLCQYKFTLTNSRMYYPFKKGLN